MNACPECKLLVDEGKLCPNCNVELSDRFFGMLIILDPENSEIAKFINKTMVGKFALKVK